MSREWTDEQLLTILDLYDNEGMTFKQIGERFGVSKNAIAGLMKRLRDDTNKHFPPCNAEGTMPRKWWKGEDHDAA
jgi:transposase